MAENDQGAQKPTLFRRAQAFGTAVLGAIIVAGPAQLIAAVTGSERIQEFANGVTKKVQAHARIADGLPPTDPAIEQRRLAAEARVERIVARYSSTDDLQSGLQDPVILPKATDGAERGTAIPRATPSSAPVFRP
ncbi:MAG: hypothetical protein SFW65_04035 [Alphaproteobacteria bacterium]|nr:hypothetical protein [Alphaproteobacteria bacterium]